MNGVKRQDGSASRSELSEIGASEASHFGVKAEIRDFFLGS